MELMDNMKFKNISYLEEIDKYQVRLVINGKDFQPTYNTLRKAIINRNKFYLQYAVFPANLFVNKIEAHELVKNSREYSNSSISYYYQVNSYRLVDRKYSPKQFLEKRDAEDFQSRWLEAYNSIVDEYNKARMIDFVNALTFELEELTPAIEVGFNSQIWEAAVSKIYGTRVPKFFLNDGFEISYL